MRSLGKKPHFWPSAEAKKGVVNCAKLRKAAHWPNNNASELIMQIPRGYHKKMFIV